METLTTITSALTLIILAVQEIRVGVPGARANLIRTLQEHVTAQAAYIVTLEQRVARLERKRTWTKTIQRTGPQSSL